VDRNQRAFKIKRILLWFIPLLFLSSNQPTYAFWFSSKVDAPPTALPPLPTPHVDAASYLHTLEQSENRCPDDACHFWHNYVRAGFMQLSDNVKACALYSTLALEKNFPLYPFVLIQKTNSCAQDKEAEDKNLKDIRELIEKNQPHGWLQYELLQSATVAALNPDTYDLALSVSKLNHSRKSKVELLQRVYTLALKTKSPRSTEIQTELFRLAPRLNPIPTDWIAVGIDALNNHEYELAVKSLEKASKQTHLPREVRRATLDSLKTAYKAVQKRKEALNMSRLLWQNDFNILKQKNAPSDSSKHALSSGLAYARFLWTDHKDIQSLAFLTKIEKVLKKRISLSELYLLRGRIFEEQQKIDKAQFWLGKAIQTAPDIVQKNSYSWNLAWLNFKLGNYAESEKLFEEQLKLETDPSKKTQITFWSAMALKKLKRNDESKTHFENLTHDDPLSYYALLSYFELDREIPQATSSQGLSFLSRIPKRIPFNLKIDWNNFDWLISVGELAWAREFLDEEAPLPDGVPEGWEDIFTRYAQASYYAPVFSRLIKLSPPEKERLLSHDGDLVFPRKWGQFVDQGSHATGLWPEFIFSIIRQESSFDPIVVSPAGAFGLMQILPSVGKRLAQEIKYDGKGDVNLLDPQNNVMLGSRHLRNYWNEFDGQFILATAAYNASPETVKMWVKTRYHGDMLVFIEDIPYEETRTYVKLVLRNFINYQRISSTGQSLPFPEWCLEM
jgi:soluble lytic murein transglycosylase